MKINAENAQSYLNHLKVIGKLANVEIYEAGKIYKILCRIESRQQQTNVRECNGTISQDQVDRIDQNTRKQVSKLLPGLKTFFINGDPRGYALKIKEAEAKEIGIHTDWGGYGILAPEF